MQILIEACIASVQDAIEGELGGANRLELNTALELDGLTPSLGVFQQIREQTRLPIIVMIRPRGNNFVYTNEEFRVMQANVDLFLQAGANGFAFGILTKNHHIDLPRTRQLANQMGTAEAVFHRAFDVTPDPSEALEQLIDCGIHRVLTSGQAPSALEGSACLASLITQAQGRIEILPGAGISPQNVVDIVRGSGCTQVHGSFKAAASSRPINGTASHHEFLGHLKSPPPAGTHRSTVAEIRRLTDSI